MADTKESNGLVVVDLCKPYGISMVEEAIESNIVFFVYPIINLKNEKIEKLNELFEKIKESIEKNQKWEDLSPNQKNELKDLIKSLSNNKFSIILNTSDIDNNIKDFKKKLENFGQTYKLKNKSEIKKLNKHSPYNNTQKLILKINESKNVYVIIPHIPKITIGILETNKFYQEPNTLAKIFYKFICKLKDKNKIYYKNYINASNNLDYHKDVLFNRKNLLAQFLQAFKIKDNSIEVNIGNFPLQYVMQRGTARIINNERAYGIIDKIYKDKKKQKLVNKIYNDDNKIKKNLSWLTPSYFEMLILILLKNEYNGEYEAYYTGGTGDYGIDGVLMDNKEHIYAIVQCKSCNLTSNNAKKLVNEIKNNHTDLENTPMIYIATRGEYKKDKKEKENQNKEELEYKIEGKEKVRI